MRVDGILLVLISFPMLALGRWTGHLELFRAVGHGCYTISD
jgi:hypothetical protein